MIDKNFWKGRKIFLTGHTGFKGSWMILLLKQLNAVCTGYALKPPTNPSLYQLIDGDGLCDGIQGDIRDLPRLKNALNKSQAEIVIHMAAQPLVIEGYKNPVCTFETNIMGTVNILEAAAKASHPVKAVVNVTTDKVYQTVSKKRYAENDRLGGFDPYSASKSCSELVTQCYNGSFFQSQGIGVATVRSGNVLGGGDFADNRLMPDCVRAALSNTTVQIRNGDSIRPWQFVLEPLAAYLAVAEKLYKSKAASSYNIAPDIQNCKPVREIIKLFCQAYGEGLAFKEIESSNKYHETDVLLLDASKAKRELGITQKYDIKKTVSLIAEFTKALKKGQDIRDIALKQVNEYLQ